MLKPRTIRGQLLAGLLVFELLLVAIFAFFIIHEHASELRGRQTRRLEYQANMVALMVRFSIKDNRMDIMQSAVSHMMEAPSIRAVQITDLQGRTILSSDPALNGGEHLTPKEKLFAETVRSVTIFESTDGKAEVVAPVVVDGGIKALAWIYPSEEPQKEELYTQLQLTLAFAVIGGIACILLAEYLARSITRPLARLLQATRRIIRNPGDTTSLPADGAASSEIADLTLAFNLMVGSIEEQRSGLNDTLGLLDSMLAHAPIGMAFFDSHARFVRTNQFFADMNELAIGKHIGRSVSDIFPGEAGATLEAGIRRVFSTSEPARDIEVKARELEEDGGTATWLVNIYPVRTATHGVRWVGAVLVDTTGIKRSEDALRRAEKLAVVGQLSSSIAHEINNPLEAITNLLYLLRRIDGLDEKAISYTELAQYEVARMSEIVQQTLRFHRQSTRKSMTNLSEIFDSVLALYRGKVAGLQIAVERRGPEIALFCFAGEIRQLFVNLIGNALDAMPRQGGRLILDVRASRSWREPAVEGIRVVIADTGSGMSPSTMRRIFEPFFTTKEATGTGLGLWVSTEIIRKHHGTIRARSRVVSGGGKPGTVFMVFLPSETPGTANPAAVGSAARSLA